MSIIFGLVVGLLAISEVLGSIPLFKANSIFQFFYNMLSNTKDAIDCSDGKCDGQYCPDGNCDPVKPESD